MKLTDGKYPKWEVIVGASDRVNMPRSCKTPTSVN